MPAYLFDRREIKDEARALLRAAKVSPLRFTALFLVIDRVLSEISTAVDYILEDALDLTAPTIQLPTSSLPLSFISILVALLSTVLIAGYACYCLGVNRGREMPYESLFDAFPFAGRVILLELLQTLAILAGLMLFIVPGFVLLFAYAFSLYHLCEEPERGVFDALRRSRLELRGYKWQFFLLALSFLPLLLLVTLPVAVCEYFLRGAFPPSLGGALAHDLVTGVLTACASVYVTPYLALAQVGFYRRVTEAASGPSENRSENEENRLE